MNTKDTKTTHDLLSSPNRGLSAIYTKVKRLKEIEEALQKYLPKALKHQCQVANKSLGKLVLISKNGAIATELRFFVPDLLRKCERDPQLNDIKQIECKVQPVETPPANTDKKKLQLLSPATAQMVLEIADTMDDPKLKNSLQRIAKHVSLK